PRRPADPARGASLPAEIYARRKEAALPDSDRKFERAVDGGSRVEPHRAVAARHSGRLFAGPIILEFGLRHFSGRPPSGFLLTRPRRKASGVALAARPPLSAEASPERGRGTAPIRPRRRDLLS